MAGPRQRVPDGLRLLLWMATLAGAVTLLGEGALHHVENKKQMVSLYAGLVTALLLWWHARHPWAGPHALELRGLRWLGRIAFSLYLVHAPVLELVWRWGVRPLGLHGEGERMLLVCALGLAASLAVAAAFHHLVERPCHRLSRAIGRRPAAAAPWLPRIA
jgi:peptidoglycan/LPS O-acetylase OafA/YrhL